MKPIRVALAILCLFIGASVLTGAIAQQTPGNAKGGAVVLDVRGAIGPALYNYMQKGFSEAKAQDAGLIIIELNTPGGLLTTTREMTTLILNSDIPVAVHVTPAGGHAASAGTFIVYASHVAAMAEGTNIGAATPIQMGPSSAPNEKDGDDKADKKESAKTNKDALDHKALADTNAFIRSLAEMRGRNVEWAQKAVTDADSLTAKEAVEKNVVELIANSREELLEKLDGHLIKMNNGQSAPLSTKDIPVTEFRQDFKTKLMTAITDPNIAMILISLGITALTLEFYNPGTMVGGVVGVICLLLGFYAMNILPVNMTGLLLVLLGFAMLIAEIFVPSFGILGIGGVIAFVLGSSMVFEGDSMPGLALDMGLVWGIAAAAFIIMMGIGTIVARSLRNKDTAGAEGMLGETAEVVEWNAQQGYVKIHGEMWQATSSFGTAYAKGDKVTVSGMDDLMLKVRPADEKI